MTAPSATRWRPPLHAVALPGLVVVTVALVGLLTSGAFAGASPSRHLASKAADPEPQAVRAADPITYSLPPASAIPLGQQLFEANCASCHGTDAYGTARGPNLVGVGAATVDFWVSTGRMPLAISSIQPVRKPPRFDRQQTLAIAGFIASLAPPSPSAPAIPTVSTAHASLSNGNDLFVLNCAGCHTVTGAGDALADGYFAPSLHKATKTQVAEAVRTGPGNMPRFGPGTLSDQQVADIVAYVTGPIQHPDNRGGLGLGGIGPVAEGFVALLIGVGGIMLIAFWLGERG
jgi:ubiquinol-cytochrome c reductase cytochrome c subunit